MPIPLNIPQDAETCEVKCGQKTLTLTNLRRVFWPRLNKTKRDLLVYYAAVSDALLPHLKNRGLAIKKYPDGVEGKLVWVKKPPAYRPPWLKICPTARFSGNLLELPMIQDLASLLWIVNLGCVDFCQCSVRCDDVHRPDYLHLDLNPIFPAEFSQVREAALLIHAFFQRRSVNTYAKTSGSRGIHIFVPIYRKSDQREVWRAAKQVAANVAQQHPALLTAEYIIRKRLPGQVFIDYHGNAGGRALSSPYSLCPNSEAAVSTPISWKEMEDGITVSDFTIDSVPSRVEQIGDLFRPLLGPGSRYPLEALL